MNTAFRCLALLILLLGGSGLVSTASAPSFSNEHLHYTINWPSGLSLGEGQLSAARSKAENAPDKLVLDFSLEAAIPGFQVQDKFHSSASAQFCSAEFDRNITHGKRKAEEKTTFDAEKQTALRTTTGGGHSELKTPACGKDALAFLYFVRHELSQGRLPPSQPVYFGSAYQVRMEYSGAQTIKLADTPVEADRLTVALKGPSSDIHFEVFFLKDAARTPALVRAPLALGTFSMELVREP